MMDTRILWFTGLSGSGKTTIAGKLSDELRKMGKTVIILDGDMIRNTAHKNLRFIPGDIEENNRLVTLRCSNHIGEYDFVIVTLISPFRVSRANARKALSPRFIEVYIKTDIEECVRRDVKGLYRKALAGEIENFIGISPVTPYEAPLNPELTVDTQKDDVRACVEKIVHFLHKKGILSFEEKEHPQ